MPTPTRFFCYESRLNSHSHLTRASKEAEEIKTMVDPVHGVKKCYKYIINNNNLTIEE
jgi:hypothetical protein